MMSRAITVEETTPDDDDDEQGGFSEEHRRVNFPISPCAHRDLVGTDRQTIEARSRYDRQTNRH